MLVTNGCPCPGTGTLLSPWTPEQCRGLQFSSDRVIAWIGTTQLKTVTGDQRHKFWPADFANGGEMNTSRARRANVGLAALTTDGAASNDWIV